LIFKYLIGMHSGFNVNMGPLAGRGSTTGCDDLDLALNCAKRRLSAIVFKALVGRPLFFGTEEVVVRGTVAGAVGARGSTKI
jgi:hypothetical protein